MMGCIRIPKLNKKILSVVGLYCLFTLLCLFQLYSIGVGSLAISVVLIGICCFVRFELLGIYLFAALPFFNVMNMSIGSTSLYYLLLGIAVIRYLIQGFERSTPIKMVVLLSIFVLTCYNLTSQIKYVKWFIRLIPLVMFYGVPFVKDRLEDIVDFYAVSMVIASWYGYLMLQMGTSIYTHSYVYADGASTTRFAGLVGDSVMYGMQLLFLIAFLFVLIIKRTNRKPIRVILVALLVYFGALTYSKTFFGCLLIMACVLYVYYLKRQKITGMSLLKNFIVIVLFVMLIAGLVLFVLTSDGSWAINFRTRLLAADLSTGRLTVWKYYLEWFYEHPEGFVRGMGFSEYATRRTFYSSTKGSFTILYAHNIFLETAVVFGIIEALLLFSALIVWMAKKFKEHRDGILFLPMLVFLIVGMISHGHFEYSTYMNLLLILMVADSEQLCMKREEIVPGIRGE